MNTIFRLVNFHQKNYLKLVETSYNTIQVAQFRNNDAGGWTKTVPGRLVPSECPLSQSPKFETRKIISSSIQPIHRRINIWSNIFLVR